ncbi:hypothetical protein EIP86_007629 [Pleurotus ostreatoroseus]|nr:hypothetical protein EIP86_007629 [Pleurotus ostreatoroseus]
MWKEPERWQRQQPTKVEAHSPQHVPRPLYSATTMSAAGYLVADPSSSNYARQIPNSPLAARPLFLPNHHSQPFQGGIPIGPHTPFRPPAHKHAHHLHTIPPREKSTRTLIIDHMLWVHARTRFAQARAELGMADRTGGAHTANFAHRERPENYDEEDDVYSEGEDIVSLTARAGGPGHTHEEDEDERLDNQDLALARNLRQRAESVEKVITSMLEQPPALPPSHPEDPHEPPTSPMLNPQGATRPSVPHEHTLPNGVRLRLALGTVINDVFARRAPSPPTRHYHSDHHSLPPPSLPPVVVPLIPVSLPRSTPYPRKPVPNDYIKSLYNIGADPDSQNSPPALRCPRHLLMGCEICVEAKVAARPAGEKKSRANSHRAASTAGSSPSDNNSLHGGNVFGLGGGVTGWQEGSGIGSGLARPGAPGTVLRRPSFPSHGKDEHMANTKLAELIVRFLRLSALVAIELGREATEDGGSVDSERERAGSSAGPANAPPTLSPLLTPRMGPPQRDRQVSTLDLHANALRPTRPWYFLLAGLLTRTVLEGYMTGGWRGIEPLEILLCVGLGLPPRTTSMSAIGDKGPPRSGGAGSGGGKGKEREEFEEFDPDDLPSLEDAVKILFPSLREVNPARGGFPGRRTEGAEQEYETEMTERLARFYDVPQNTPDVATHMEDLAWQYPAEAVERAACRFCEAVARWRGKPELETYKKASWIIGNKETKPASGSMSLDALVHSNPTSPSHAHAHAQAGPGLSPLPPYQPPHPTISRRPSVDHYFSLPPALLLQGRKRRRSDLEGERPDEGRRTMSQMFTGS